MRSARRLAKRGWHRLSNRLRDGHPIPPPPGVVADAADAVAAHLDKRFDQEGGLYGRFEDIPLVWQTGHYRRMELLDRLDIGDVTDKVCLDFASGSWGFACMYPRIHHCKFAYGMDISQRAVDLSIQLTNEKGFPFGNSFTFLRSDGMNIPLPDASVDLVFAGEAIEHIRFPKRFLRECHRVLRDGGQLVLTTPNSDALLYRTQGELYCVGLEHFWLFSYRDLREFVEEFFSIEEACGFNGSLFFDLDKASSDRAACDSWTRLFADRPEDATGVIMRARKTNPDIRRDYSVTTIDPEHVAVTGAMQVLDLDIGLKVQMIHEVGSSFRFTCPPCSGFVLNFCSHKWSGHAEITAGSETRTVNLYSRDLGWRPVHFAGEIADAVPVEIRPLGTKDERSLNTQVIFLDAFTYRA